MRNDGRRPRRSIHATAVAIAGRALLLVGRSGSGKSRLALDLIAASTSDCPIRLVGDDRIFLMDGAGGLLARGHPRIHGFIERRGLGIEAVPFVPGAPVCGIVDLQPTTSLPACLENFPCLSLVSSDRVETRRDLVLRWWRGASTTQRAKPLAAVTCCAED